MGKFMITQRKDGKQMFNLHADNGQIILTSQGYTTRSGARKGIASVKINSQSKDNFLIEKSKNGKHHFSLIARNNKVIGKSEMYESEAALKNGLASVIKNAHNARIE
jgi:hypothetical protein